MMIRMLRSYRSAPDGIRVQTFEAGKKYDLPQALALGFIEQGVACEDKDMGGAPEVKEPALSGPRKRRK
jgi:hypothetical protein